MESKSAVAAKFTTLARDWSAREYNNPAAFMERRAALVQNWGATLSPGDRILELGCGDGALSCFLAGQGFDVTGVDISPGMIDEARRRATAAGVPAKFEVGDADTLKVTEHYEGIVSFMGAFFTYSQKPGVFLQAAMPFVRKKVILDWNFRSPGSFIDGAQVMRAAGLTNIEWRPWFISHQTTTPSDSGLRSWIEERPNLSLLLLTLKRWHYTVQLKGEKIDTEDVRNGSDEGWRGNPLPGSFLQRSLMTLGQLTR
jgi:SAM-dependent methyltransferase